VRQTLKKMDTAYVAPYPHSSRQDQSWLGVGDHIISFVFHLMGRCVASALSLKSNTELWTSGVVIPRLKKGELKESIDTVRYGTVGYGRVQYCNVMQCVERPVMSIPRVSVLVIAVDEMGYFSPGLVERWYISEMR